MEMKTTVKYHLTPVRMATIKKIRNNKCWQGCGEKETLVHCWWECKLLQPLWKESMEVPQKIKNRTTSNSTSGYLSKEYKKTLTQKDVCTPMFIAAYLQ